MTRNRATGIGAITIILWSLLAVLTVYAVPVPPLLLNALTFGIGGVVGLAWIAARGRLGVLQALGWRSLAFGTAGLFGYHALYFSAIRLAPPAEAGLVNYLWPLLVVLFSGLLPGEHLRKGHLIGAGLAFVGVAIMIAGSASGDLGYGAFLGLGLAFVAAFVWALYSVGARRMPNVPTEAVALYCLATAVLSVLCHLLWEDTLWPQTPLAWGAIFALGLGPVGIAFYTWDIGMKQGDIQLLGVMAYAAPLLSTICLVVGGVTVLTPAIGVSALMITLGALLAARA